MTELYHGTSDALPIHSMLYPSTVTKVLREQWRTKNTDCVYLTNSMKSARYYAKKAVEKYGGHPIVYVCSPRGCIYRINTTEYTCSRATITGRIEI